MNQKTFYLTLNNALHWNDAKTVDQILQRQDAIDFTMINEIYRFDTRLLDHMLNLGYQCDHNAIVERAETDSKLFDWLENRPEIVKQIDWVKIYDLLRPNNEWPVSSVRPSERALDLTALWLKYNVKRGTLHLFLIPITALFLAELAIKKKLPTIQWLFSIMDAILFEFNNWATFTLPFLLFHGIQCNATLPKQTVLRTGKTMILKHIVTLMIGIQQLQLPNLLKISLAESVLGPISNCVPYFWFAKIASTIDQPF